MTVIDYLVKSAERLPDKVAFADSERALTFAELLDQSRRAATVLINDLKAVRRPVIVLTGRNVTCIPVFMGIAMSRNFYVPLGSQLPWERIEKTIEQMRPVAVIDCAQALSPEDRKKIAVPFYEAQDLTSAEANDNLISAVSEGANADDPIYAICTSGSTGTPKGVVKSHRSVLDFIPVFTETFGLNENDVFGNQAPFDFDVSGKDIFSALFLGASVFVIPTEYFTLPKRLVDALDEKKVTVLVWAVSALCIVAAVNAFKKRVPQNLRAVLFSGEVMPVKLLNVWRRYLPDVMYVNLYGPTEVTYNCMYYIVDRDFEDTEKLPLGKPFLNQQVLILGDGDVPAGPGSSGEICVTGGSLALGYYRDGERTAGVFVQNPLNSAYPERMYRTGDIARITESGEIYFNGRKDFQIKHMGHRIELEEIDLYLGAVEGVTRACTFFDDVRNKIVACYSGDVDQIEIITSLRTRVPKYMIPSVFIKMDLLPLNKNGKTDRRKLREEYDALTARQQ